MPVSLSFDIHLLQLVLVNHINSNYPIKNIFLLLQIFKRTLIYFPIAETILAATSTWWESSTQQTLQQRPNLRRGRPSAKLLPLPSASRFLRVQLGLDHSTQELWGQFLLRSLPADDHHTVSAHADHVHRGPSEIFGSLLLRQRHGIFDPAILWRREEH